MKKKCMSCGAWLEFPSGEDWDRIWFEHNRTHPGKDGIALEIASHPDIIALDFELDEYYGS